MSHFIWEWVVCYLRMSHENWKLSCHVVRKQSFCHFLNWSLNQKTSFIKVVQKVSYSWKLGTYLVQNRHFVAFLTNHGIEKNYKKCSQTRHFVTFLIDRQIRKLLIQILFRLVRKFRMSHLKWKFSTNLAQSNHLSLSKLIM